MNKIALITGATSGIGKACSEILAANGSSVIITGRRKARLEALAENLRKEFDVQVLALTFDVRNQKEVKRQLTDLPEPWKKISILVNNAGLAAGADPIDKGLMDDWERMIDTNIKGLLYVSQAVIPHMKARGHGHIINVASIAGKEVYPNGNVYCATKYAVDALSQGMRIDLLPYNIKVTNIAPGMVETEFSEVRLHGDKDAAKKVYQGMTPLAPQDIAHAVWFAASRPDHVQIADMVILPADQASATQIKRQ